MSAEKPTSTNSSSLTITNGTLVNASGALIEARDTGGSGSGTRTLTATLNHQGTLQLNYDLTINGAAAYHVNSGTINVQGGDLTVMFDGSSRFTNQSGGVINIWTSLSRDLIFDGSDVFTNDLGGIINGSGGITLLGGATFVNNGTLNPGLSPGVLEVTGDMIQGDTAILNMEIAGVEAGLSYDQFLVSGNLGLGGTLNVDLIDGFAPTAGDAFRLIEWGSMDGGFLNVNGLASADGLLFDADLDASGLTLTAEAITHQGGAGANDITGTGGRDVIHGGAGDDSISGLAGDDVIYGGEGDDSLDGGMGDDLLDGAGGIDWADYSGDPGSVTVNLEENRATDGHGDTDTLFNIENVVGSDFNDALMGSAIANTLRGRGGDDRISGGGGADVLEGGAGADVFAYADASEGGDTIVDFTAGEDMVALLAEGFGNLALGTLTDGVNFSSITGSYDGTIAGTNSEFDAGNATFIFSEADDTLYYDANGAVADGYTAIVTVQDGASVTAAAITVE